MRTKTLPCSFSILPFSTLLLALALVALEPASAQSSPVPFPAGAPASFEFSLTNPGARSLGLGGAFVALADDATAAFANPAGLVQLVRPEVSIEARRWEYTNPYVAGGRLSGSPTGQGLDTDAGLRFDESREEVDAISFASVVIPRQRWSLAFTHHRQLDYRYQARTEGIFGGQALAPFTPRHPDYRTLTQLRITSLGASLGVRLSDAWSVGFGVSFFEASIDTLSEFFVPIPPAPPALFAPLGFDERERITTVHLPSDDSDWGFNLGILWKPDERWSFGASYREGAQFDHDIVVTSGPAIPGLPPGTELFRGEVAPIDFPDVYGLGGAWRSGGGALTVSLEWDRVEYSSIIASFERDLGAVGAELDDADEVHFGVEWALLGRAPILALRAGAWLDPDHRIRGRETSDPGSDGNDEYLQALFPRGEDQWHATIGLGIAFERLQIDLAADLSDEFDTVAISAITTF